MDNAPMNWAYFDKLFFLFCIDSLSKVSAWQKGTDEQLEWNVASCCLFLLMVDN